MGKPDQMNHDYSEFEIRRKGWPKRVSKEEEVRDGFFISGPEIDNGEIRLWERANGSFAADSPWRMMTIQGQGQGTIGHFTLSATRMQPIEIDVKVGSYLDLSFSGDKRLRFKNRTLFVHRYRFDDRLGQIEVRAETRGLFKGGPFPNEWKKIWKIAFIGQLSVDKNTVLPPLAVFLCYFKSVWPSYDTMF